MTIYGIRNCNKIRDTLAWMERHEVEHTFVDLKKTPLTRDELNGIADRTGLDALVNRRGMTWRRLGLSGRELSPHELTDLLLENQSMIVRPLIVTPDRIQIGYDEDAFQALAE